MTSDDWSQRDMEMMINATPMKSWQDDLVEDLQRIDARAKADILRRFNEARREIEQQLREDLLMLLMADERDEDAIEKRQQEAAEALVNVARKLLPEARQASERLRNICRAHRQYEGRPERTIMNQVTIDLPPEFIELCQRDRTTPEVVLRGFIADLCGIHNQGDNPDMPPRTDGYNSNGSDEREMAWAYYNRADYIGRE